MDKQKARRRQAARAGAQSPAAAMMDQDDQLMDDGSPTGALAEVAEDEEDLDPIDRQLRDEQRQRKEEDRQAKLDAFGQALGKRRQASIDARDGSGIDTLWQQDEEFYEGIDDANRGETITLKPRNQSGGASIVETASSSGSNVFLNITRPYVDFSAARACDMLLPTDDSNWDLRETPMPDVIGIMHDETPLPNAGQLPAGAPSTYGQAATKMVEEAKAKVEKAKKRIDDWLGESQFHAEQRKQIRDAAKVGVGVLKGPFPVKRKARVILRDKTTGAITMQVQQKLAPASKCISYRNLYPAPGCGQDIHDGDYIWERDEITARQLRDLQGTLDADQHPLYLEAAIDACLKEGPAAHHKEDHTYIAPDSARYEIWYYHGTATAEDLRAAGVDVDEGKILPVVVTMVNERVIKAELATLDSGSFPYDVMVWQEREGHWAGIGVARQVRAVQRIINGAVRNLMDNAGFAAGPQFVFMKGAVTPAGGGSKYSISPRKMWEFDPSETNIDDVRKAFAAIQMPMLGQELLAIVQFALKMAEDITGMPMLMQGQQGQASDTVGGMNILNNNSNTPMRSIAKLFDDRVTVPHLLRYYEWLLLWGEDEDEKGEFVVEARGSSALFERDAQNQAIMQMAPLLQNPAFKINPEKWFKEALKAQRLDPDRFQYNDLEWAKVQQQMAQQPPPVDPKIQVAQIGAQSRVQAAQITAGVQEKRIQKDTDRDTVFAQNELARTQSDERGKQLELDTKLRLAYLDYALQNKKTLDEVKAELATTTMKLNVQKELSELTAGVELHKHHNPSPQVITPPTEPAGRAPDGQAFQA